MTRVLLVGETAMVHSIDLVGADALVSAVYTDSSGPLIGALRTRHEVEHLPAHLVRGGFPKSTRALSPFDVVILSDIGAGSFLEGAPADGIDRLGVLAGWVSEGGGLLMIGGYLSFAGCEGKARYAGTAIAGLLPVELYSGDDRREAPAGAQPHSHRTAVTGRGGELPDCPVFDDCPALLGWNRTRIRSEATLLATIAGDPLLAVRDVGRGRTAAFTSDCAPHWAPEAFHRWHGYAALWCGLVDWLGANAKSRRSNA